MEPLPTGNGSIGHTLPCEDSQLGEPQFAENGIPLDETPRNSDDATNIVEKAENTTNVQVDGLVWTENPSTESVSSHTSSPSEETGPSSARNEEPSIVSNAQQLAASMKTANSPNLDPHENPNTPSLSPKICCML
ncbi:hypothetical protein FQN49_004508 [Arthroderma sp. PD_2]|nr:hypothetical protein FQN49_004508 [Arthroderma sp. PD_2]